MAPAPRGSASYKKQNGILAISKDRKSVSWSPAQSPDSSPIIVIAAANITNLQQTPESSAKVMLKIFAQEKGQDEPVAHVFSFTSTTDARAEANAIKDSLASVIQAQKAAQNAVTASASGASAAMTIAQAISGGNRSSNIWEDDERLKADVGLQQSLMREDDALRKTFMEALSLKPSSISTTQFTSQFWASRVHLLRAHAIAKSQSRGTYNVFSTLKREEGGTKMNLSAEHVHLIFAQYPIMRRVFDELVPRRLNEIEFWSRFFQSQLYMTLRGLKFDRHKEIKDEWLDQYLDVPEITGLRATPQELQIPQIPRIIDMEGNEENHSQRKGNRPDFELRPQGHDKVPIIRTLNSLSEKLMAQVRPSDVDPSAPIGMGEATYENLRLRDLAGDPVQNRIILKIQDQSRFFSDSRLAEGEDDAGPLRKLDPVKAVQAVRTDLARRFPHPGFGVIRIDTEELDGDESDEDENSQKVSASAQATAHIISLIRQHRAQTEEIPASSGLSTSVYDRLTLTHATTIEFLHQFWSAFLSGDPSRAGEVGSLAESLRRCVDRIQAVADAAQAERDDAIRKSEQQVAERLQKTGKRHRIDYDKIGGGAQVVRQLLGPVSAALTNAIGRFEKALAEQM